MTISGTAAWRGKRYKTRGCRRCKREHRAHFRAKKYATLPPRCEDRWYCNGKWET